MDTKDGKLDVRNITNVLVDVDDWESVGLELGISATKLSEIRTNRANNASLCKISMADTWLRRDTEASWKKLADALEKTHNIAQAEKIRETHHDVPCVGGANNKRARLDVRNPAVVQAGHPRVPAGDQLRELLKCSPQAGEEGRRIDDVLHTILNNNDFNINFIDVQAGGTPLHDAIRAGDIATMKALIALGAKVNLVNSNNLTALDTAKFMHRNNKEMADILKAVGGVSTMDIVPEQETGGAPAMELEAGDEQTISKAGDRVLCLDNSSTMALVQLELLSQIEKATGKKITELFQWIVASGIGGVLMLVMVYGGKSIEELRHFYYRLYYQVFNNPQAKDKGKELERMVIDELGDAATHGNAVYMQKVKEPKLLIGAVNKRTSMLDLKFFSNCPSIQEDDMHVWKVARCTCSSPLFFGEYDNFIDTGVICKNPCGVGLEKMEPYFTFHKRTLNDSIAMVVSLGDGIPPADVLGDAGELPNFVRLFNSAANYQSEHISSALCCRWCESRDISFFRFNPLLKESIPVPEGASVEALINVAIQTIAHIATGEGKETIEKMQKEL